MVAFNEDYCISCLEPQAVTSAGDAEGAGLGEGAVGTSAVDSATSAPQEHPSEYQSLLGNIEIPEGVDPSFLAALPEEMRQEVIAEQLRLQRLRQRARAQATDASNQVIIDTFSQFNI